MIQVIALFAILAVLVLFFTSSLFENKPNPSDFKGLLKKDDEQLFDWRG